MSIHWTFSERTAYREEQRKRWNERPESDFAKLPLKKEGLLGLQAKFQGKIISSYDPQYNQLRKLSNPKFDDFPALICMCVCENDVRLILEVPWSNTPTKPLTIRSGGHCTAGFSAGPGFLLDVSGLNDVHIDVAARTAVVGAGCTFQKLSPLLDQSGLHLPIGDCPDVAVAGYMQGGGYSFTSRTFGMQCDSVLEVRVMLWDGTVVVANTSKNFDLFWAVCGGTGGNFGVLLSVTFRLYPLGQIMGFAVAWSLETQADRIIASQAMVTLQQNFLSTAPLNMTPQMIFVWQPKNGNPNTLIPMMLWRGTFLGPLAAGMVAITPALTIPGAQFQWAQMGIFSDINNRLLSQPYSIPPFPPTVTSAPPEDKQARYVSRNLTQTQWQKVLDWFVTSPSQYNAMCFEVAGGAINALPLETNAFIHRTSQFSVFMDVFWLKPADQASAEAFLASFVTLFNAFWNSEVYQNYANVNIPDYRKNYWGKAFYALAAVKAKYDPNNFFNFAQAATSYPSGPVPPVWPAKVVAALQNPITATHVSQDVIDYAETCE
jgi:FAD/FMN-containing dehydrogenase